MVEPRKMLPKQSNLHNFQPPPGFSRPQNDHCRPLTSELKSPVQQKLSQWHHEGISELPADYQADSRTGSPTKVSYGNYVGSPVKMQSFDDCNTDSAYNSGYNSVYGSTLGSGYGSMGSGLGSTLGSAFGSTVSELSNACDADSTASPGVYRVFDQIHGKSPSWPVAPLYNKQPQDGQFVQNRSTSWSDATQGRKNVMHRSTLSYPAGAGHHQFPRGDPTTEEWCSKAANTTHREETVSPETAKRIFREAAKRNERQCSTERNSGSWMHESPLKLPKASLQLSPLKSVDVVNVSNTPLISNDIPARSSKSLPRELKMLSLSSNSDNSHMVVEQQSSLHSIDVSTGNNFRYSGLPWPGTHKQNFAQDVYQSRCPGGTYGRLSSPPEQTSSSNVQPGVANQALWIEHQSCKSSHQTASSPAVLHNSGTPERPKCLPGVSPRSLATGSSQSASKDQVLRSLSTPGINCNSAVVFDPGSYEIGGDRRGGVPSQDAAIKKILTLPLSSTSVLRKLSQELYGQSVKYCPAETGSAVLESKPFQKVGLSDETSTRTIVKSSAVHGKNQLSTVPCGVPTNGTESAGVGPELLVRRPLIQNARSPKVIPGKEYPFFQPGRTSLESFFQNKKLFQEPKPDECDAVDGPEKNLPVPDSPSPPMLPPRRYRSEGCEDNQKDGIVADQSSVRSSGFDFDSPVVADIYADQLRKQAKRYSHPIANHSPRGNSVTTPQADSPFMCAREGTDLTRSGAQVPHGSEVQKVVMLNSINSVKDVDGLRAELAVKPAWDKAQHDSNKMTESGIDSKGVGFDKQKVMAENDAVSRSIRTIKIIKGGKLPTEESTGSSSVSMVMMKETLYTGDDDLNFVCVPVAENVLQPKNASHDCGTFLEDHAKENGKLDISGSLSSAVKKTLTETDDLYFSGNKINHSDVNHAQKSPREDLSLSVDKQRPEKKDACLKVDKKASLSVESKTVPKERSLSCHERWKMNQDPVKPNASLRQSTEHLNTESKACVVQGDALNVKMNISCNEKSSPNRLRKSSGNAKDRGSGCNVNALSPRDLQENGTEVENLQDEKHNYGCNEKVLKIESKGHQNDAARENSSPYIPIQIPNFDILKKGTASRSADVDTEGKLIPGSGHKSRRDCFRSSASGCNYDELTKAVKEKAKNYLSVCESGQKGLCKNVSKCTKQGSPCKQEPQAACNNFNGTISSIPSKSPQLNKSNVQKFLLPSDKIKQKFEVYRSERELVREDKEPRKHSPMNRLKVEMNSPVSAEKLAIPSTRPRPLSPNPLQKFGTRLVKTKFSDSKFANDLKVITARSSELLLSLKTRKEIIPNQEISCASKTRPSLLVSAEPSNVSTVAAIFAKSLVTNETLTTDSTSSTASNIITAAETEILTDEQAGLKEKALDRVEDEIYDRFICIAAETDSKTATHYLAELLLTSGPNESSMMTQDRITLSKVRNLLRPFLRHLTDNYQSGMKKVTFTDEDICSELEEMLSQFEQEKLLIEKEISDCTALGHQVTLLAEEKLGEKEFGKYMTHLDEQEKILCLVLNLTRRLCAIECSIRALPKDVCHEERAALISKRNDLTQKYEDAKALSEGIARRRHLVMDYLKACLSQEELCSFERFLELKLRLFLEKQAIDDLTNLVHQRIKLSKQKTRSFQESESEERRGGYGGYFNIN